ncbi:hypothetical protein BN1263130056 [Stenotrophomonas thermophila]|nr:hypothetical protein BN1263130056 [Stenotrophomonas maltophilia]
MYFTRLMSRPSNGTRSAPRMWPPVVRCTRRTASDSERSSPRPPRSPRSIISARPWSPRGGCCASADDSGTADSATQVARAMRRWKGAEDIDAILAEHGDSFKSRKSGSRVRDPAFTIPLQILGLGQ